MSTRIGAVWTQQHKLTAADGGPGDVFGSVVGISGNTTLVGASFDDTAAGVNAGSAYAFNFNAGVWSQQAQFMATADANVGDALGSSVAVSGLTFSAAAPVDDTGSGTDAGSVYVFQSSSTHIPSNDVPQQTWLTAPDGASGDQFGYAVALGTDTLAIGAPFDDTGAGADAGSVYVFTRTGGVWSQQAKLTPSDAGAGDQFGFAVALGGDILYVGAPFDDAASGSDAGSVTVFSRSGSAWTEQAKIEATDPAAGERFGHSLSGDDDDLLVGVPFDRTGAGPETGSAYVFARIAGVWTIQGWLTAVDGQAGDRFGVSVGFSGSTALVGSYQDDNGAGGDAGSAYVFARSAGSWNQEAKLMAADGTLADRFGSAAAIDGDVALIGAPTDDAKGATAGSAYAFLRADSIWVQETKLVGEALAGDNFGASVAVDGLVAVVGAPFDDDVGSDVGLAFAYGT